MISTPAKKILTDLAIYGSCKTCGEALTMLNEINPHLHPVSKAWHLVDMEESGNWLESRPAALPLADALRIDAEQERRTTALYAVGAAVMVALTVTALIFF